MVKILDNGISATKGDTVRYNFVIKNNDGSIYHPVVGDVIHFGLKESYDDTECIITKEISTSELCLILSHDDTKNLKPNVAYVWDIQIEKVNGDVETFDNGILLLTPEVYDL